MTKRALLTGSARRVEEVGAALESAGFVVSSAVGLESLRQLAETAEPLAGLLDVYVQLPVEIHAEATTVTGQIEALLRQGILLRFALAQAVLPLLGADARVVLVTGNLPPESSAPDDHHARVALLRVLAHALRADRAPQQLAVTVAASDCTARELCRMAEGHPAESRSDYASLWPEMDYDDWRLAVLSLASVEG